MTAYNNYYDVVIVRGGPAGLRAAQILGRCRRQTILFDEGNQRNLISKAMHGIITREGISPNEFLQVARNELAHYENFITLQLTTRIVDAKKRKEDGIFELQSEEGEVFYSNYLLLATGEQDGTPQIKNFMQFYGSTVHRCPICDGWEKCGKDVIVWKWRKRKRNGAGDDYMDFQHHLMH
jgi:thioredoxin reductase